MTKKKIVLLGVGLKNGFDLCLWLRTGCINRLS